jgi:hypothetical protein
LEPFITRLRRNTKIAAPIMAGRMANPARLGPHVPRMEWPIQAPTRPATIAPRIPPGMRFPTIALPINPITIATSNETRKPNMLFHLSSCCYYTYILLPGRRNISTAGENTNVSFGLMRLEGKKMSTRRGRVVTLKEVMKQAYEHAKKISKEKNPGRLIFDQTAGGDGNRSNHIFRFEK